MTEKKLIEDILLEKGKVNEKQLSLIKSKRKDLGEKVIDFLMSEKIVTEETIAEIISEETGLPFVDLKNYIIDPAVLNTFDEPMARRLNAIPIYLIRDTITVAISNPKDFILVDDIKTVAKSKKVQFVVATKTAIIEAIDDNYTHGRGLEDIIKPLENRGISYAPISMATPQTLASLAGQPPVVKFVNQMIFDALKRRASDIHIEPLQDNIRVRYRIDGLLQVAITIPRELQLPVVPRLKILANLDIAESRKPQDGRFSVTVAGRQVDLRVATYATAYGENMTIRLLDKLSGVLSIEELGFPVDVLKKLKKIIRNPHGIILNTGPTGCGKTTTLYSILKEISSPEKNIITIEDPIEYLIDDVNQAQINPKIGLDFATALRSFLRQDPDVLMIGEIRDRESADMAFRAALTGHLVISTLHTNDAPSAITRLKDIGLDNSMISTSLLCILAQRLVRHICPNCKQEYIPNKAILEDLGVDFSPDTKYYKGRGCAECGNAGYKGRVGIIELFELTEEIRLLIQKDTPLEEIRKVAGQLGMRTLKQDGLEKVKEGVTTLEEVLRICQD